MEEATAVVNEFARFAASNYGSDVLDAAEATLRRLSRIEQSIEPLFAGLRDCRRFG
ncbi:hypothetical protein H5392_05340 [Tessaracoccus sp. MC1865]|uniref:hypothetical protein n=1 Tax=Tessaracoccus sp. MC1865 TaxID=2760310 RepID=UPI0016023061|nr:hypothetical protein [Tessaracoccus sp. MC1865]MBB1483288.1 hypothetical protein [Tessaracoccus sp. MC1865]QTO37300.1 hypothetical protein J7D54_12870 [Tessaracoccus sp. MC1865]